MTGRSLLALGAVLGGLVALLAAQGYRLTRREYLPTDPGYEVDLVVGRRRGGSAPLRLAVLGDSTVAGVGAPTAATSLPALVAERVAADLGRPVAVTGYGISGARVRSLAERQLPQLDGDHDVVLLVVGSNDATHLTPPWSVRRWAHRMLDEAGAHGAPVVLGGTPRFARTAIIPEPLRTLFDRWAWLVRRELRAAAAHHGARFVDIAAEASPRFAGRPDATSRDGFHPSPIGYGFWADALAPAVVAAVRDGGR